MPEYYAAQCSARGPGLTHMRDYQRRPDGSCIECGTALTSNPDAIPRPASDIPADDRGHQMPYAQDQCPARGPALSHYMSTGLAGPCTHCRQQVVHRINPERMFERASVEPPYAPLARLHSTESMIAFRSKRPLNSARHANTVRMVQRAIVAEREDPEPDFFGG